MNLSDANEGKNWSLQSLDYAVPENAQRFGYSLGGIVLVGYLLASLTGLIIAFLYIPTVDGARESVAAYTAHPLGLWLRSFHRWSADVILYLVILHMSRVVFTGSYRGKRKANWLFGIVLLFVSVPPFSAAADKRTRVEPAIHKELSDAAKDAAIDSDVATIHRDVSGATVWFVLKGVVVALSVAGLAFVYLRRPKTGVPK